MREVNFEYGAGRIVFVEEHGRGYISGIKPKIREPRYVVCFYDKVVEFPKTKIENESVVVPGDVC